MKDLSHATKVQQNKTETIDMANDNDSEVRNMLRIKCTVHSHSMICTALEMMKIYNILCVILVAYQNS